MTVNCALALSNLYVGHEIVTTHSGSWDSMNVFKFINYSKISNEVFCIASLVPTITMIYDGFFAINGDTW